MTLREHLVAAVREIAAQQTGEPHSAHRQGFKLGPQSGGVPCMTFGYQYSRRDMAIYWDRDGGYQELTFEAAADRFLKDFDLADK